MANIINAIINLVKNPVINITEYSVSHNRANSTGESLEEYIKDLFAGTVGVDDFNYRNRLISETFSYLGNQNNPPDSILRNGDAIEVKKIENKFSALALNSSYPKAKLYSNSKMITSACKNCEDWTEKDIIYCVGVVNKNRLSVLSMVYGIDYAASAENYERIKHAISTGIKSISDIEFSKTNELGRVNRVDPLGITYLRIRGMWHIENPMKVFSYLYNDFSSDDFNLISVINKNKYYSCPAQDIEKLESLAQDYSSLKIIDVLIKNPDNPAILNDAKLIIFTYKGVRNV